MSYVGEAIRGELRSLPADSYTVAVYSSSMRVRVTTRRKAGRLLQWNGVPEIYEGELAAVREVAEDRSVIMLVVHIGAPGGPRLVEPKLVSTFGREVRFTGLEKVDGAWVLQEWNCEILALG